MGHRLRGPRSLSKQIATLRVEHCLAIPVLLSGGEKLKKQEEELLKMYTCTDLVYRYSVQSYCFMFYLLLLLLFVDYTFGGVDL
jgi:hypothetical protein